MVSKDVCFKIPSWDFIFITGNRQINLGFGAFTLTTGHILQVFGKDEY